jgi:hypothetical protein
MIVKDDQRDNANDAKIIDDDNKQNLQQFKHGSVKGINMYNPN